MNKLTPAFAFMIVILATTAGQARTDIQVTPANPGACETSPDLRSSNLEVLEVQESTSSVSARLRISNFECSEGMRARNIVASQDRVISILPNGFNWPWTRAEGVVVGADYKGLTTPISTEVTLTFDKNSILNGHSTGSGSYLLTFEPESSSSRIAFTWIVDIDVRANETSRLKLTEKK